VDENTDIVSGGGITTHHDRGVVVLIKVGVERRPPGCTPSPLLFEQANPMEVFTFTHQAPLSAIFPVVAQAGIEGTKLCP
jgi:hypothetical protein